MRRLSPTCVLLLTISVDVHGQLRADSLGPRITIGVLAPAEWKLDARNASTVHGTTLGVEEGERTASMFGWELMVVRAPDSLDTRAGLAYLSRPAISAIIGDFSGVTIERPRSAHNPVIIDIGKPRRDGVNASGDNKFHLLPLLDSARWERDGKRQPFVDYNRMQAWNYALERFGAAQLNDRYRRRFGAEMDERAWAGWMAVKILVEAVLRTRTTEPRALESFLISREARFDGHKGERLYFHAATRELVQPLFPLP